MRAVVYLRFPRPRNGIADPSVVDWNSDKEKELWTMLKSTSTDLEWQHLAQHFNVPIVYILQQAAWLYEKELGSLRRKMSRISQPKTSIGNQNMANLFTNLPSSADQISHLPPHSGTNSNLDPQLNRSPPSLSASLLNSSNLEPLNRRLSVDSEDEPLPSRRLLSASRADNLDSLSDFPDSDLSLDGFVVDSSGGGRSASVSSGTDSTVSQSALEAALMERSGSELDAD